MADSSDPVAAASQLLTVYLHCRKEAEGLSACQATHGASSGHCTRHQAAFVTCANANAMMVVGHLVKIADRHCTAEVAEYQRCKMLNPASDCEELDLAAMQCASRRVLQSAQADSPAR